jgi:hypothetical protein
MSIKKAKVRVSQFQWSVPLECQVEILTRGHFPDTVIALLPNGQKTELDTAYLTRLH